MHAKQSKKHRVSARDKSVTHNHKVKMVVNWRTKIDATATNHGQENGIKVTILELLMASHKSLEIIALTHCYVSLD